MKTVQTFVTSHDDLNEDNISEYLQIYRDSQASKSKDEVNNVNYFIYYLL